MTYANSIQDFLRAFNPEPLTENELPDFYCDGTIEFRTGDKSDSPIDDIIDACQTPLGKNSYLLLGHRGCGKSTELNRMALQLEDKGHYVKIIDCKQELDLPNLIHTDLLTLMGEALVEIANQIDCSLDKKLVKQLYEFWDERESEINSETLKEIGAAAGLEVKSPGILSGLLNVFAGVKAGLKYNQTQREIHRQKIKNRSSEWIQLLQQVSIMITKKLDGKQPILIFEELDKADQKIAWDIFEMYSNTLTEVSFPVIYTFPIELYYSPKFKALEGYFEYRCFPMIKQEQVDGTPFEKGTEIIKKIVAKRAKLDLFEEGTLELMIKKTGGSLRDLFNVIRSSTQTAKRNDSTKISMSDTERALSKLKSDLTRRIERKNYDFLADIYRGNREKIENKEMLLEMLKAGVVLEYNGERWHSLHPLIAEFLEEQKLTYE
jgi:Cdc6-like AAA superfamily ATPase